jgi:uncharacterized protein (TIGR00255 family)
MIKSMTAYGRGMIVLDQASYVVEITSVNRKNLDLSLTLPKDWLSLEIEIRKWIIDVAKRGSIIIKFTKETSFDSTSFLQMDLSVLKKLKEEITELQAALDLKQSISFEFLYEQASKVKAKEIDVTGEDLLNPIKEGISQALSNWNAMRHKEALHLKADLEERLQIVSDLLSKIEVLAPKTAKIYEEKLKKRLIESNFFQEGDFERICKEVLIFSDKIDITEEMIRLRSHIAQFIKGLDSQEEAIGKKLDFLMQEMHREANSLGVKCQDLEIIQLSVMIKSELEKIREQVQNIE